VITVFIHFYTEITLEPSLAVIIGYCGNYVMIDTGMNCVITR